MKLNDIKANPTNPRIVKDEKFDKLVQSILTFPQMLEKRPIVIDENNTVLGGNMRLRALQHIKKNNPEFTKEFMPEGVLPESWVSSAAGWTEEQKREFVIKDNVSIGEWDFVELNNNWDTEKLDNWGVDLPNFEPDELQLQAVEDDFDSTPPELPKTVLGDLYEIGEHRLLCGDSTDSEQVAKLMNGEKADMAHNDPPYGMKKEKDGVLNDNLNFNDLLDFNRDWIALQFIHLKDNGSFYCWGIDEPLMDIYSNIIKPYIAEQKATFRNLITWDKFENQKPTCIKGMRSYVVYEEKCLFVMCGVQGFNNNSDNYFEGFEPLRNWLIKEKEKSGLRNEEIVKLTATTHTHYWSKSQWALPTKEHYNTIKDASNGKAFLKEYEEVKKEYEEVKKEWYKTRAYFDNTHETYMTSVWRIPITSKQERELTGGHATPKPIPLCERAIKCSCPDNGLVIDFFLGSGSTMVASHQLKRKCYGMELDPKYCDVIVRRMIKLDPNLIIKRNGVDCKADFLESADEPIF